MLNIPTKNPGDSLTAAEWNSGNAENQALVTNFGQTLNGGDNTQFSKSAILAATGGDYFISSGPANAYVLSAQGAKQNVTFLDDGASANFIVNIANSGPSTVNLTGTGVKAIKKSGGTLDLESGDFVAGNFVQLRYKASIDAFVVTSFAFRLSAGEASLFNPVSGFVLSNNVGDPDKMDFGPGTFIGPVSQQFFTSQSTLIKNIGAGWAEGNNLGGLASGQVPVVNDTWYHMFALAKPDGTVDFGFETSLSGVNILADAAASGYTEVKRIGSMKYLTGTFQRFIMKAPPSGLREFFVDPNEPSNLFTHAVATADALLLFAVGVPPGLELQVTVSASMIAASGNNHTVNVDVFSPQRPLVPPVIIPRLRARTDTGVVDRGMASNDITAYTDDTQQLMFVCNRSQTIDFEAYTIGWVE